MRNKEMRPRGGLAVAVALALGIAAGMLHPAEASKTPKGPCGTELPEPIIESTETHQDLVLTGSRPLLIENKKYIIKGDIKLSGDAVLTILNSEIKFESESHTISVADNATLDIVNTIFPDRVHAFFSQKSTLIMDRVFWINVTEVADEAEAFIYGSCIFEAPEFGRAFGTVGVGEKVYVEIADSAVGSIALRVPSDLPLEIDGLKPGYFESWEARQEISSRLPYNLVLARTEIQSNPGIPGEVEMGWNIWARSDAKLKIQNSVLNKLIILFEKEDVHFSNLKREAPIDFNYRNIQLSNTYIQGQWGIFVSHGETQIEESTGIWLWLVGKKDTFVTNTEINEFDPRQYTGTVHLSNSSMTNGFEVFDSSVFRLEGSIDMQEIGPGFTADSSMTRNYEVIDFDSRGGTPLDGTELSLTTKGGEVVWAGKTDAGGRTDFDITFGPNNAEDQWTLSTIVCSTPISIYTDTPVHMVNLEPVSIVSIDIVARSIKTSSRRGIQVAILSSADLDTPSEIDKASLTFGSTGDENSLSSCAKRPKDMNTDRLPDIVCTFDTQAADFVPGDAEGILKGNTLDGCPIEGRDSVRITK